MVTMAMGGNAWSEQQQQALDANGELPPRFVDPRSKASYYLVGEREYEAIRGLLKEVEQQRAIRSVGMRNAVGRIESEP